MKCNSCGQTVPLFTLPDYDPARDTYGVCDPCRDMSRLRSARETFGRDDIVPAWVERAGAGLLPYKVYAG